MYIKLLLVALLLSLFSLLALSVQRRSSPTCTAGLIGLRPLDPLLFAGVPSKLCCVILQADQDVPLEDIVFHCLDNNVVPATEISSNQSCGNVTASVEGFCLCSYKTKKTCSYGSQYVKIDEPLPSILDVECVNYWNQKIICNPKLPHFRYAKNVRTEISSSNLTQLRTLVCESNSCEVNMTNGGHQLNFFFNMPQLTLHMSVRVEYRIPDGTSAPFDQGKTSAVSSKFLFNASHGVVLKPINEASVQTETNSSITITWPSQSYVFQQNKVVRVNYTAAHDQWQSFDHIESMDNLRRNPSATLSDLRSFTTYKICLTSKTVDGYLWNVPVCFDAKTLAGVPERSPATFPDAFAVVDDSSIMIYWQNMEDWEWNDDSSNRSYILQAYQQLSQVSGERCIDWTRNQTTVDDSKYSYFSLIAANNVGRTTNVSLFEVTPKDKRLPLAQNLQAVYDIAIGEMRISWQAETDDRPFVYWCQQGEQPYSCQTSIGRVTLARGATHYSFPTSFTLARGNMYGVSLSRRVGPITLRSGIYWKTCISVVAKDNSTSLQGNCKSVETLSSGSFPGWAVGVIIFVFVVIFVAIPIVWCVIKFHKRRKSLYYLSDSMTIDIPTNTPEPPDAFPPYLNLTGRATPSNIQSDSGHQSNGGTEVSNSNYELCGDDNENDMSQRRLISMNTMSNKGNEDGSDSGNPSAEDSNSTDDEIQKQLVSTDRESCPKEANEFVNIDDDDRGEFEEEATTDRNGDKMINGRERCKENGGDGDNDGGGGSGNGDNGDDDDSGGSSGGDNSNNDDDSGGGGSGDNCDDDDDGGSSDCGNNSDDDHYKEYNTGTLVLNPNKNKNTPSERVSRYVSVTNENTLEENAEDTAAATDFF